MTALLEKIEASGRVDRASGIIRGVKLLGENSRNGRRYSLPAMREATRLYDNAKCFLNHERSGKDRKAEDLAGKFKNVRFDEASRSIIADLVIIKSHPFSERLLEIADEHPDLLGFSHCADGSLGADGIVSKIHKIESVDIVTDPATAAGLFESAQADQKKMSSTTSLRTCCQKL